MKEEKIRPIKPSEVTQCIPNWIIKGANECIKAHYQELNKESYFTQDTLIEYCLKYAPNEEIDRKTIFDNHWLDIEPIYRKEGWIVEYDKPAYCENYAANFTFKIPEIKNMNIKLVSKL